MFIVLTFCCLNTFIVCTCVNAYYKDQKCTVNENPSMHIESAGSKTCDNRPLKKRLYVGSKIVCFYESDHAFKTIWRRSCLCHLIKIKGYFLKPARPVFIIVINTSCLHVCYRIYARPISCNVLTIGIYSYILINRNLHV